eukprot:scaffold83452_cov34-Tisochrysis_lutea.AAC.2
MSPRCSPKALIRCTRAKLAGASGHEEEELASAAPVSSPLLMALLAVASGAGGHAVTAVASARRLCGVWVGLSGGLHPRSIFHIQIARQTPSNPHPTVQVVASGGGSAVRLPSRPWAGSQRVGSAVEVPGM